MYYVLLGSRPDPAWFPPGLGGSAAWGGRASGSLAPRSLAPRFPGPQVPGAMCHAVNSLYMRQGAGAGNCEYVCKCKTKCACTQIPIGSAPTAQVLPPVNMKKRTSMFPAFNISLHFLLDEL